MHVRENLSIDQTGNDNSNGIHTTFTERKTYTISRFTLIFIASIFLCSIVATALLIYNFATCSHTILRPDSRGGSVISLDNHANGYSPSSHEHDHETNRTVENLDLRLPRSILPILYEIKMIPYLFRNNFTFAGEVQILINVTENCQNITLHAIALTIADKDVRVRKINGDTLQAPASDPIGIKSQYFLEAKQFYVIELNDALQNGSLYSVEIKYTGVLNDILQGFYRSSYTIGNATRWVAATQFQPTDARRALPCFDEPALKAKFKLTLARPRNMTTISNMPQIGQSRPVQDMDEYVWDEYMESLPMSTYLLAFVVTDFQHKTSGKFSVWTRQDAIRSAEYALSIAPKILKSYESFFGIPYPLPKVDMIALPDFTAGAMENWGLITYRETAMLFEEGVSARINKFRVASVVAHELAHQWFGNMVTPAWWSDLWLNEGFATYMEYVGVDAVEPTWKSMDQFVLNEVQGVFTLDALSTSHKIWIEVHDPDEINEIFDRISYGKGATIIRMMDHFLTTKVFTAGLKAYLIDKQYQAAEQDDLWRHLTDEARRGSIFDNSTTVKEIMDTWTLQTGYPVVNVTIDYQNQNIEFKQKRFGYESPKKRRNDEKENPLWWIPITYTTAKKLAFNDTKPTSWMRKTQSAIVSDPDLSPEDWILVNIKQTGYYRVNYDRHNWKLLTAYMQDANSFAKIAPANRAQLIDDALNLARGGNLDYSIAMNLTKYLAHENEFVPWKAAIYSLNYIDSMLIKGGDYHKFKKYVMSLIEHVYLDVQFNDPPEADLLTGLKRIDVLNTACHFGYEDCVDNCRRNFLTWMMEGNPELNNPISPNLRPIVYCTAIKYGDQKEWDFAWERFQKTTVSSEKEILLSAMGCSRETWILRRYLERSLIDEYGIRKHDVFRVVGSVSSNVLGQPIAFNFLRTHWHVLKEYMGNNLANLNGIAKFTARRLNNRYELDEFKRFTHQHTKDTGRTIQQAVEEAESNIQWMDRNYKTIIEWLGHINYENS